MSYLGFTLGALVGVITEGFSATINGTTRQIGVNDLTIQDRLSAPSTADVFVRGFTPAEFSDVRLYNGGTGGVCLFGGTAIVTEFTSARMDDDPWWHLQCQDYTWLLNRFKRVRGRYTNIGVNTALRQMISAYADVGFRVGYCPSSLGNITDLVCEDVPFTTALDQLSAESESFWDVDADKRVHIFSDPDHLSTDAVALTDTSKNFSGLTVLRDGTEIATRVMALGKSTATTSVTAGGATSLAVDDVLPFVGGGIGGSAFSGGSLLAYTGTSVQFGPGNLTGVTGIANIIEQGAEIRPAAVVDDTGAQTALATLLGGGQSGVAVITVEASWANVDGCAAVAAEELARRSSSYQGLRYRALDQVHTGAQATVPGQTVSVTLTDPASVSGTFRVQDVQIGLRPGGKVTGTTVGFERRVSLGPYFRALDMAKRLAGRA